MSEDNQDELRRQREIEARAANKARNDERLERLNNIANQADERKSQDGMEDLEDEAWTEQGVRAAEQEQDEGEIVAEAEETSLRMDLLQEAMAELSDRERHILTERRLKDDPTTLEELASEYGVSRERVRQSLYDTKSSRCFGWNRSWHRRSHLRNSRAWASRPRCRA